VTLLILSFMTLFGSQSSFQSDFDDCFDIVAKIGEGWFSRVYLAELTDKNTRQEVVVKAINCKTVPKEEFQRELR